MTAAGEKKVTINEPFELAPNQYEVIKELAHLQGESSVSELIRWYVIKGAECDIEHAQGGGPMGQAISDRLAAKWGAG